MVRRGAQSPVVGSLPGEGCCIGDEVGGELWNAQPNTFCFVFHVGNSREGTRVNGGLVEEEVIFVPAFACIPPYCAYEKV